MKIAILTHTLGLNYGGVLQCYALTSVLRDMGHEVVVLNRRFPVSAYLKWLRVVSMLKCFVLRYVLRHKEVAVSFPLGYYYITNANDKQCNEGMMRFVRKHIPLSKSLSSTAALEAFCKDKSIDAFIAGSDQVWREKYVPSIEDYFFGFLPTTDRRKRIAYAASFGTSDRPISAEKLPVCKELASRFSFISVREQSGIALVRDYFGKEAHWVLDPTLLLDASRYRFRQSSPVDVELGCYILDKSEEKERIMQSVEQALNLHRTEIGMNTDSRRAKYGSMEHWLNFFADAQFIVTDSFHGCVFSIINNRPFVCIVNAERGADRFSSLFECFGLHDRMVASLAEYEAKKEMLLHQPIDYDRVNQIREEKRTECLALLKSALEA